MGVKILSVVNQKGGVGKTTTAINTASFLSDNGHKVLLIDIDPQANATSGLGLKIEQMKENIYDLIVNPTVGETCVYPTAFENLHVIPGTKHLSGAEVEMVGMESRETILKDRLASIAPAYDYVIIDCPPSLGLLTLNALVASHKTIIPLQTEYFALEGIAKLLDTLNLVKDSLNPDLEICGIVLTMYDRRTLLNRQVVENARSFFKELVFETVVPRNVRITEAPSHGLPIALYSPSSKGASAYYHLAKEVTARV